MIVGWIDEPAYVGYKNGVQLPQEVNEVFTASPQTFDPVRDSSEIEFPAKDPTRAELGLRQQRMAPRLDRLGVLLGLRAGQEHRRR